MILVVVMILITVGVDLCLCYMHYPKQKIDLNLQKDIMEYGLIHFTKHQNIDNILRKGLDPSYNKPMSKIEKDFVWFFINYPDKKMDHINYIKNTGCRFDYDMVIWIKNINPDIFKKMKYHKKKGMAVYTGQFFLEDAVIMTINDFAITDVEINK